MHNIKVTLRCESAIFMHLLLFLFLTLRKKGTKAVTEAVGLPFQKVHLVLVH